MNTWESRIKSRMKELEMTQEELANKLGITRGAVTHYLAGRRVPPLNQFQKLAHVLKVDPAWLQYGVASSEHKSTAKNILKHEATIAHYLIPIFSWKQAAERLSANQLRVKGNFEYIPHFYTDQSHWYALRVQGDAMVSANGLKSFHEGDLIIVDTDKEVKYGDFVIAVLPNAKEATFKQYMIDGGVKYLKPLNTQYPLIAIDAKVILTAVVVKSINHSITS